MLSDIEIAQRALQKPIVELARERLGIPEDQLEPDGRFKANVSLAHLASLASMPEGKLIRSRVPLLRRLCNTEVIQCRRAS